jgi:rhodanese-related sulfurtransferase
MRLALLVPILAVTAALLAGRTLHRELAWPAVERAINASHPGAVQLSTAELATWQARKDTVQPVLLDVRGAEEYGVSRLLGARWAPDLPAALGALATMPGDTAIVVYCSIGYRSAAMAEKLQQAGYANVQNLAGSIFQWANEGRPVYRGAERVHFVHPYSRIWSVLLDRDLAAPAGVNPAPTQDPEQ